MENKELKKLIATVAEEIENRLVQNVKDHKRITDAGERANELAIKLYDILGDLKD